PGIVGFGVAGKLCMDALEQEGARLNVLRNKLEDELLNVGDVKVNGNRSSRLPNVTNLSFASVEGEGLRMGFNKEIAVSSGSACTSGSMEPSFVLKAMGVDDALAFS